MTGITMTNSYFKIVGSDNKGPFTFFPFDDTDVVSTHRAYWYAKGMATNPFWRLAVYKTPKIPGPWQQLSVVGDGIDGNEYLVDDDGVSE